ncbi:MAG: sigma-70 family RNA polymerase sigma factor [Polyangiaceae bacterium]
MTAVAAEAALHQLVRNPETRVALRAYARRRGLRDEAEDVVQAVLCAAVAAPNVPSEPEALPRWIHGILRRKVADVFRQRRRAPAGELSGVESATEQAPAFEARDFLRRIDSELNEPRQRHALGWMLREHAGESLLEIARQEAVSPENLRQRICRLRRHLRAQFVVPLVVLLAFGATSWNELAPQVAEAQLVAPAARPFVGRWRVEQIRGGDAALVGVVVQLEPAGVSLRTPQGVEFKHFELVQRGDQLSLVSGEKRWSVRLTELGGGRVSIESDQGYVELRRLP